MQIIIITIDHYPTCGIVVKKNIVQQATNVEYMPTFVCKVPQLYHNVTKLYNNRVSLQKHMFYVGVL